MATATESVPAQKVYRPLLEYLAEVDAVPVRDLPKEIADAKRLQAAWSDGVIEFGRREYIETGEPSPNSAKKGRYYDLNDLDKNDQPILKEIAGTDPRYIVELGISWTGLRATWQKSLKDLLAERPDIKPGCNVYLKQPDGSLQKVSRVGEEDLKVLALLVRCSDKGHAALAA